MGTLLREWIELCGQAHWAALRSEHRHPFETNCFQIRSPLRLGRQLAQFPPRLGRFASLDRLATLPVAVAHSSGLLAPAPLLRDLV